MNGIVEHVAKAVRDQPTTFDGDPIGVHLSNSMMIDASTSTIEESRSAVMGVCKDAARAAIKATLEYLSENVSHKQIAEGWAQLKRAKLPHLAAGPGFIEAYKAAISQALKELDASK